MWPGPFQLLEQCATFRLQLQLKNRGKGKHVLYQAQAKLQMTDLSLISNSKANIRFNISKNKNVETGASLDIQPSKNDLNAI